jgi:uncharacterized protein (DUF885 family)
LKLARIRHPIYAAKTVTTEEKMKQGVINEKYQVKKYTCRVDKFRRSKGCKEKIISHARNRKR